MFITVTLWHPVQLRFGCSPPSCLKAPAEFRLLQRFRIVLSVIPMSAAKLRIEINFQLLLRLQELVAQVAVFWLRRNSRSALWQVKQTAWLLGTV